MAEAEVFFGVVEGNSENMSARNSIGGHLRKGSLSVFMATRMYVNAFRVSS